MPKWTFLLLLVMLTVNGCSWSQMPSTQTPTQLFSATATRTKTPTPNPTETVTFTPHPTQTPQKVYSCSITDNEDLMPELHLATDLKSQDWAHYLLSRTDAKGQISANPSILVYFVSTIPSIGGYALGATIKGKPGWNAKTNKTLCVAKINPIEFGLADKSYAFIVSAVIQDYEDNRAILNIIIGKRELHDYYDGGWMPDPGNTLNPNDISYVDSKGFILEGAKPGGPDDLRDLIKNHSQQFYTAQGVTRDDVINLFKQIEADNGFSSETQERLNSTIFFGGYGWADENVPR